MPIERSPHLKLVLVRWMDAWGGDGVTAPWINYDDYEREPAKCFVDSVGWLVKDSKDYVVVLPNLNQYDHEHRPSRGCGEINIPRKCVVSITVLKRTKEKLRAHRTITK